MCNLVLEIWVFKVIQELLLPESIKIIYTQQLWSYHNGSEDVGTVGFDPVHAHFFQPLHVAA